MTREQLSKGDRVIWTRRIRREISGGYDSVEVRAIVRKCDGGLAALAIRDGAKWIVRHARYEDLRPDPR